MLYTNNQIKRIDQADANGKIDQSIERLKSEIKRGDEDLRQFQDRNVYDTFEIMNKAAAWNHKRYRLVSELTILSQERQRSKADDGWRPAPSTFFIGSEG